MDSMIPLGQKNILAEYMILFGAKNHPPMSDKDLYDSWKKNGVTKTKKYTKLSAGEKIQADCDMKATNIILQGPPSDIYSLVNHHRVAKDLWERVQLLMQGTSFTKQERECKLYDSIDKFTHIKGELLQKYYLRFTELIKDINIYNMKMEQFQVNTKFLNSLPPEWIFSPRDDLIACLNMAIAFLTVVAFSRRVKGKVILVLGIRVMLLVLGETLQVDMQGLLNATTVKVKDIWLGNALSLSDQGMQHGIKINNIQDLETYDSDCDDVSNAKAILMANISNYGSDVISEVRIVLKCAKINKKPDNIYTRSEDTKKSQIRKQVFSK
nr:hypothetical protein [Tanacetum cinerariifolium]